MAARKQQVEVAVDDVPQPFNLDAISIHEPTGLPVTIKGVTYHLKGEDDLSIDDQENLRRYSLITEEMKVWDADPETGLLSQEQKAQLHRLQLAMCRIVLPSAPDAVIDGLDEAQATALVALFTRTVDVLPYFDRIVLQRALNRLVPTPLPTSGAATTTPTASRNATSGARTRGSSPTSAASTGDRTPSGDALTA